MTPSRPNGRRPLPTIASDGTNRSLRQFKRSEASTREQLGYQQTGRLWQLLAIAADASGGESDTSSVCSSLQIFDDVDANGGAQVASAASEMDGPNCVAVGDVPAEEGSGSESDMLQIIDAVDTDDNVDTQHPITKRSDKLPTEAAPATRDDASIGSYRLNDDPSSSNRSSLDSDTDFEDTTPRDMA